MVIPISVITKDPGTCAEFRINAPFVFFQNKSQKCTGEKNVLSADYQKIKIVHCKTSSKNIVLIMG